MAEPAGARDTVLRKADELKEKLKHRPDEADLDQAAEILGPLRDWRAFGLLGDLAEAVTRERPDDVQSRKFYAQALIDTGKPTVAIDVLNAAIRRIRGDTEEKDDLKGLLGRAFKDIYVEADDPMSKKAKNALKRSINAYREPFDREPGDNTYHGINLSAVLAAARRDGFTGLRTLDPENIAGQVLAALNLQPESKRDGWWSATKAEAHVARREWRKAESALHDYVSSDETRAFNLASTTRQFRDVWRIQDQGDEGSGLLQILEARLMTSFADGAADDDPDKHEPLMASAAHIRAMRDVPEPEIDQLERVLGDTDTKTIKWYRAGLNRAGSVAAVRKKLGKRFGTGFAVKAGDLSVPSIDPNEILVLTNYHVVNTAGEWPGAKPDDIELLFEAADTEALAGTSFDAREVVSESSFDGGLDYALLRLDPSPAALSPIPVTDALPDLGGSARVYLIGHPRGDELQFSLQDNRLLDHEGEPDGTPPIEERRRVHYFAPTARGSSGSPVFDESWRCIALHHAGRKFDPPDEPGMGKLNGKRGAYSANEGIWIGSIIEDLQ